MATGVAQQYTIVGNSNSAPSGGFNPGDVHEEFNRLKQQEAQRNYEYFLLRQAVAGNFQWPRNWPGHIEKVKHNLCRLITRRQATYLMGKGFNWNVQRPNTLEYRDKAERTEKILARLLELSQGDLHFGLGALNGAQVGRTVFKVYRKGPPGAEHACFSFCQPDYFYGIPAGGNMLGEWARVYYSYPVDIEVARATWGNRPYKTEAEISQGNFYDGIPEQRNAPIAVGGLRTRRVPVLEAWTNDSYLLEVGGVTIYNGKNTFRWSDTDEGFVPFVVIENIRNAGDGRGESDIKEARELNEQLNYLLSRKNHIIGRWLVPTLVWEGAPQDYARHLQATLGGGGALPTRLGSRLYFLDHASPNPAVQELEMSLRQAILESAGMNEVSLGGNVTGSINTGPSVGAQFAPSLSVVDEKRREWSVGLKKLFAMILQTQENIGDSKALGEAVVNQSVQTQGNVPFGPSADGELVQLSGTDIDGLRAVDIDWPGVLPKDDLQAAQLEIEKYEKGIQSLYTTSEKLGEQYPDDEVARIRMENSDPALKGQAIEAQKAEAQAAAQHAQAGTQAMQQMQMLQQQQQPDAGATDTGGPPPPGFDAEQAAGNGLPSEADLVASGNPGAQLRELRRRSTVNLSQDEAGPVIEGY